MGIVWVEVVVMAVAGVCIVDVVVVGTIVGVDVGMAGMDWTIILTPYLLLAGIFISLFSFLWTILQIGCRGALVLSYT